MNLDSKFVIMIKTAAVFWNSEIIRLGRNKLFEQVVTNPNCQNSIFLPQTF